MKVFRRLLIAMIILLTSCEKEPDVSTEQPPSPSQREVKIDIILNLNFELKLSGSDSKNLPNPGYNTEDGFSDFDHVFADQIDLVFNSTTSDYTNTLTFNPNDLSTPPTIIIPYGSYTWSIEDKTPQNPMRDYVLRDYLPVFGGGALEIASQSVVLNLNVDSEFGLVTVEKALIDSAKIINSGQYEKEMKIKGDYLYLYVFDSAENEIEITESVFNTTIKRQIDDTGIVEAKKHYNYYLRVSETGVNSITIESGPFEKKDYALIPGPVYLDANGVTVKARGDAEVGKTYILNGESYLVVNETILRNIAVDWRNNDLTKVVTTKVTSFEGLFWYELYDWFAEKNQAHQMYEGLPEDHFDEFNQDLGSWDTSNVTHMGGLFERTAFNHDISKWDTSKVTHMWYMFAYTQNFDQDLSWMDTSNVVYMNKMFKESSFNGDISGWDVGKVENMTNMFENSSFNGDISQWDTSSVIYMSGMFASSEFNQPIGGWNTSSVTNMSGMFAYNSQFDQDISNWDTSKNTTLRNTFLDARSFNQDLNSWNTSSVIDMNSTFTGAYAFDGDISSWDVSNVKDMSRLFASASEFNKDISSWDVANVIDMWKIFNGASSFNQDLSIWDTSSVEVCQNALDGTTAWVLPKPDFSNCSSNSFSLRFNNVSQNNGSAYAYCDTNLDGLDLTGDFTIEYWLKPGTNDYYQLMGKNRFGVNTSGWLIKKPSSEFKFGWTYTPNEIGIADNPSGLNSWVHFAFTYDKENQSLKSFINGELVKTSNIDINITPSPENFFIGKENGTQNWYVGNLDELHISNSVRYTESFTVSSQRNIDENTILYYSFEEVVNNKVLDISGNGRDLYLVNAEISTEVPN